jgi:site-specific DNA-methyltransferase (adenine-specific)
MEATMATTTNGRQRQTRLKLAQNRFDVREFLKKPAKPAFVSELGALFAGDCLDVLPKIKSEVVDTVFADPPFNLGKEYGKRTNDLRPDYLDWCRAWLDECVRVLKPGGAIFVYNLPKWNISIGAHLMERGLEFRHWIAIEISACLPIPGRLHPSHYSLLYYTKGKPKTFRRIRTPIATCRHCGEEVKDYGGHRGAMNPNGVTLKDVWTDIPPVRHAKFKSKDRKANALSTKTLDRVVEMSTVPGDVVLDPFGGSGTTFSVCEAKQRRWLGVELDFADVIAERIESDEIRSHKNSDFVED